MRDGEEFDTIRRLLDCWGANAEGIGDDAAVLDVGSSSGNGKVVVSTDATVEGVHFIDGWLRDVDIGFRAANAALSDLAAMGAHAHSMLISFTVPATWRARLEKIAEGIGEAAESCGAKIIGGNISAGETFSITLTVIGIAKTPIRRDGASPGDMLLATGILGGPREALNRLRVGETPDEWSMSRFARPIARIKEGVWLAEQGFASAMIDISDGLVADASHIAHASGVDIELYSGSVRHTGVSSVGDALNSGEEYELLVAVPGSKIGAVLDGFPRHFQTPIKIVGVAARMWSSTPRVNVHSRTEPSDDDSSATNGNSPSNLVEIDRGHDHFSR
jgi:thiamine-monophosphate kinase